MGAGGGPKAPPALLFGGAPAFPFVLPLLLLSHLVTPSVAALTYPASPHFDAGEANATLHLAWSAYCNETALRAWDCEWCTGPFAVKNVSLVRFLQDKEAGTQGFVGVDKDVHGIGRRIIVSFRGSKNFENSVEDAEFWLTRLDAHLPAVPNDVKVDSGFLRAYVSLRNASLEAIETALEAHSCQDCEVLFTGHSLGAAMATIGASEHSAKGGITSLFTFGSPRVGNKAFVNWSLSNMNSNANSKVLYRMRRQQDIVPAVPPRSIGYVHFPTEVWNLHGEGTADSYKICDGSGEDPKCGDSEEKPFFPADLLHLKPAEHTQYMGYRGGDCLGGYGTS